MNISAPRVETFGTFDGAPPGGASGTPKELKLGYLLQPARGGNYTLHVKLSNEVSNSSLNPIQVGRSIKNWLCIFAFSSSLDICTHGREYFLLFISLEA
jgi:hypothetical protein